MRDRESDVTGLLSKLVLGFGVAWAVFLIWRFAAGVAQFKAVFLDFGMELPPLSVLVLQSWFNLIVPVLTILAIAKEWLPQKKLTLTLNVGFLTLLLIFQELFWQAMLQPLYKLVEIVSGGG